jgi:hypothetical protein
VAAYGRRGVGPPGLRPPQTGPSTRTVAARINRLARRLGEHPAALMPFSASVLALLVLPLAMLGDQDEQLVGQGDSPAAAADLTGWTAATR